MIKKTLYEKLERGSKDNFNWQTDVLQKIRQWFKSLDMKSEDAFRIIDIDYDQIIDKKDLYRFLKDILKIPKEELNGVRIDRLYN